ncbi:MAG: insulinase family protein, partial [Spirochaetia bacterium]|nr:insulinase family protein [Spirochaetia bacterium]
VIFTGTYVPPHNSPDFYALQAGNYILGGGSFNSRLMREIRTIRGLAYYAYSRNIFQKKTGYFASGAGTRIDKVSESLSLMLEIIGGMKAPVKEQELDLARESIINSLVFQFDNPEDILDNEIRFINHGMPENYLKMFPEKINALSREQISKAFQKHIKTDSMHIAVAGPASLKAELETIRPVIVIKPEDTSIPGAAEN